MKGHWLESVFQAIPRQGILPPQNDLHFPPGLNQIPPYGKHQSTTFEVVILSQFSQVVFWSQPEDILEFLHKIAE